MKKHYNSKIKFCECEVAHASHKGFCKICRNRASRNTVPCLNKDCKCNKK